MHEKQDPQTWQTHLGNLITNRSIKRWLADKIGVQPITLKRWTQHENQPRIKHMRRLVDTLRNAQMPEAAALLRSLTRDIPALASEQDSRNEPQIPALPPAEFYASALNTYATSSETLSWHTFTNLLLQQLLGLLDPYRHGMMLTIAICAPPPGGQPVRSLREVIGCGTPPWPANLNDEMLFLGSESLAGAAMMHHDIAVRGSREEVHSRNPIRWEKYEQSAAAVPIMRFARTCGCLIASSARPYTFQEERSSLLKHYAPLFALAFEREAFFDFSDIALQIMPDYETQKAAFRGFSVRVTHLLEEAAARKEPLLLKDAEQRLLQIIEEELLELARRQVLQVNR